MKTATTRRLRVTFRFSTLLVLALGVVACAQTPADQVPVDQLPVTQNPGKQAEKTDPPITDSQDEVPVAKPLATNPNGPHALPDGRRGGRTGGQIVALQPLDEPEAEQGGLAGGIAVAIAPTNPPAARVRKRMNIDQLDAAMRTVTGGAGWTTAKGKREFEALALTLGKPNYTDTTTEDLEASSLFQKFLMDAAQAVCAKVALADKAQPVAAKRQLARFVKMTDTIKSNAKGVDANLAWLIARYHNRVVPPSATELEPWRFLFETATKVGGEKPHQGWRTVCVALMVHPHFYTY